MVTYTFKSLSLYNFTFMRTHAHYLTCRLLFCVVLEQLWPDRCARGWDEGEKYGYYSWCRFSDKRQATLFFTDECEVAAVLLKPLDESQRSHSHQPRDGRPRAGSAHWGGAETSK